MGLMSMLLHLADENARERREIEKRGRAKSLESVAAALEQQEWAEFKTRLHAQYARLLAGVGSEDTDVDIDEDDFDALLKLIDVLEASKNPLTLAEIVRSMQNEKVLAREFPFAARAQTLRLLSKLRALNRVWQDLGGRWALLRG